MKELQQPILWDHPEAGHSASQALSLEQFLTLLRAEEDYYPGEQHRTRLMVSRLRKIFYDMWGWNKQLIRGAAKVENRYEVSIVDEAGEHGRKHGHQATHEYDPKYRLVTYRADDRVYGDTRVGQVPEIYRHDHQEVLLPEGWYCDLGHVLAGLDAGNYPQVVTPVPHLLQRFVNVKWFPHCDSNLDTVTWLGDIGMSAADFMFAYLRNGRRALPTEEEQKYIDIEAPGSDMLGDIDPYVIRRYYDVGAKEGRRVTDILHDYYAGDPVEHPARAHRFSIFAEAVGLQGWDGERFANETAWKQYYDRQLRDNTTFQVFSLTPETLRSVYLPWMIWRGGYKPILKFDVLLELFLVALRPLIKQETLVATP
jgi:hypothetical protein